MVPASPAPSARPASRSSREPPARPRGPRGVPAPRSTQGSAPAARAQPPARPSARRRRRPPRRSARSADCRRRRRRRRRPGAWPAASHVPSCANPRPRAARQARADDDRAAAPALRTPRGYCPRAASARQERRRERIIFSKIEPRMISQIAPYLTLWPSSLATDTAIWPIDEPTLTLVIVQNPSVTLAFTPGVIHSMGLDKYIVTDSHR
ncbi:transcriptional regulatory protein AlgP-like [Sorex fumeus]|uniref:transcriptional regulatory protein AlgP-like n=1 Tax=Sorex fumeus TaxID=62283 RepID=UPI0024ACB022|nr:transcriptional regulatory protein AlgP-like [Sorex fumeus]